MKSLALPVIVLAVALNSAAFFGIWTAPGLDALPTMQSLKKEDPKDKDLAANTIIRINAGDPWVIAGVTIR